MRAVKSVLTFFYFSPLLLSLVYPFLIGSTQRSDWSQLWPWAVYAHYLQVFTLMAALLVSLRAGHDGQRAPIGRIKASHMAALARILVLLGGLLMVLANYTGDIPPVNITPVYFFPVYLLLIIPAVLSSLSDRERTDKSLSGLKYLSYVALIINGLIIILLMLKNLDAPGPYLEELLLFSLWPIFVIAFLTATSWRCSLLMHLILTTAIGLLLIGLLVSFWPQGEANFAADSLYSVDTIQNFLLSVFYPLTFAGALIVMIGSIRQNISGRDKPMDTDLSSDQDEPRSGLGLMARFSLTALSASLIVAAILFYGLTQMQIRLEPEAFSDQLKDRAMGPLRTVIPTNMHIDHWTMVFGQGQDLIFFKDSILEDKAADQDKTFNQNSIHLTETMRANSAFIYLAEYNPGLEIQFSRSRPQDPNDNMTLTLNLNRPECLLTFWASYPIEARTALDPYKLEDFKAEKAEELLKTAAKLNDAYHYLGPTDAAGQGFATRLGRLDLDDETLGFQVRFKQITTAGTRAYLSATFNPPPGWIRRWRGPANQIEMIAQALNSVDYFSGLRMISYNQARNAAGLPGLEKVRIGKQEAESTQARRTGFFLRWESKERNHHNLPLLSLRYSYHANSGQPIDMQNKIGYWDNLLNETSLAANR